MVLDFNGAARHQKPAPHNTTRFYHYSEAT